MADPAAAGFRLRRKNREKFFSARSAVLVRQLPDRRGLLCHGGISEQNFRTDFQVRQPANERCGRLHFWAYQALSRSDALAEGGRGEGSQS